MIKNYQWFYRMILIHLIGEIFYFIILDRVKLNDIDDPLLFFKVIF
jgi:hypothetical protein